jgi:hypothetical protein
MAESLSEESGQDTRGSPSDLRVPSYVYRSVYIDPSIFPADVNANHFNRPRRKLHKRFCKWKRRYLDKTTLSRPPELWHSTCCLLLETAPKRAPLYLGKHKHRVALGPFASGPHTNTMMPVADVWPIKTRWPRQIPTAFLF